MKIRVHIQGTHQMAYLLGFGEYRLRYGDTINPGLYNELSAFVVAL